MQEIIIGTKNICRKCGYTWIQRSEKLVKQCYKCHSSLWNTDRKFRNINTYYGHSEEKIELIIKMRQQNLCLSLQQIGDRFGLSRERIRQILKKANEYTSHYKQKYICNKCGKEYTPNHQWRNKLYCCIKCRDIHRHELHWVKITCATCGIEKDIRISYYKRQIKYSEDNNTEHKNFCNKKCQGKWLGNFRRSMISKYSVQLPKIQEMLNSGKTLYASLKLTNISMNSYTYIKRLLKKVEPKNE